jgi:hypothetical protein
VPREVLFVAHMDFPGSTFCPGGRDFPLVLYIGYISNFTFSLCSFTHEASYTSPKKRTEIEITK